MKYYSKLLSGIKKRKIALFASLVLFLSAVVAAFVDKRAFAINSSAFLIYVCLFLYTVLREVKSLRLSSDSPLLSAMTLDFITGLSKPVVIVNKNCVITWYNKQFLEITAAKGTLYGKNIADEISHNLNPARLFREENVEFEIALGDRQYRISCSNVVSSAKSYCVMMWDDCTELYKTKQLLDSKDMLCAFIVIDNFSEAMQFVQDKSRTASAVIGAELDKWCASIDGIIKEYDREKYIVVFEKGMLETLRENKFEILDTIRSITIDDVAMQFSASIGVAAISGTLSQKEAASRTALDLALQRGGDQAVVKTEATTEFFGGRSQSVQKKTKVRSRVVANELSSLIKQSSNVLVMGHKYADHDCVASCVAVSRIAKHVGKQVNVIVNIHDYNLKPIFNSMRGQDGYVDLFVDRENAQELMSADTLLVVCDVNNVNLFEVPEIYMAASKSVILDHHRKTAEFVNEPVISYIEPAASSVSELMCEILEQVLSPGDLPAVEANLLFSGLTLDTKQFTKNTGVRTFGAALYLRSEGANPYEAQKLFRTSAEDFMRESLFENNIQIYRETVAISTYESTDGKVSDRIAAAKAADRLLTIEGVCASFVLCTIENEISISARSDGNINVQLILESLGGGGHFDAAGAQIKDADMLQALQRLKNAIDNYFDAT
ncbi:MAG: DHH family phosphoesterase [Clostridia bacterium]|nr:DHH family phosphoesterase [Clostridia bacterium]